MDNLRHSLHRGIERLKVTKEKVKKKFASSDTGSAVALREDSVGYSARSASSSALPQSSTVYSITKRTANASTASLSKNVRRLVPDAHVGRSRLDAEILGAKSIENAVDSEQMDPCVLTCAILKGDPSNKALNHVSEISYHPGADEAATHGISESADVATRPSAAGDDQKVASGRRTVDIAKSAGKLALKTIKEVSDALPPLKSLAAGLNLIVENVELAGDNRKAVNGLLTRIGTLRDTLDVKRIDVNEKRRQVELEMELDSIAGILKPLKARRTVMGFITASETASLVKEYIQKVQWTLTEYQVSVMHDLYKLNVEQIELAELVILDRLAIADNAAFNESDTRSSCLPRTREEILDALREWADDPNAKQVFWLNGHAGSGKSTIAQSFAEWLFADGRLGGSFFCSRDSEQRSSTKSMFPTITYQLATGTNPDAPKFRRSLMRTLKAKPKIASLSLQNQLQELLVTPATESGITTFIVIDALDECKDEETTSIILKFLDKNVKHLPNIKFFITSRPETHIREGFRLEGLKLVTDVMILHDVAALSVDGDIMVFLETRLTSTAALANRSDTHLPQQWPTKAQLIALTKKSGGLFIFASTVIKLILDKNGKPERTLEAILSKPDHFIKEGTSALDDLYREILRRAFGAENDTFMETRRAILGLLVVACDPLSATAIANILGIKDVDEVKTCLRSLHSLLAVPDDPTRPIRFHHKSFPDFLTDSKRCKDSRFYINKGEHHLTTAYRCFVVMSRKLKRNICGLKKYSTNDTLNPTVRDECIDECLRYSCRYWPSHLPLDSNWEQHLQDIIANLLDDWMKTKLLQWFEALALLHELGRAVEALNHAREWLTMGDQQHSTLRESVTSSHRFLLSFFDAIQTSVAHIYHSALPFAPKIPLWDMYRAQELYTDAKVLQGCDTRWTSLIRTVQVLYTPHAVRYSHDGSMLAVGGFGFSQLLRSGTGERLAELESGDEDVLSISFSQDDRTLAMASGMSIRLWDISTGSHTATLHGDGGGISSVEFHSHIDNLLVAGDESGRVYVWDARRSSRTIFDVAESYGTLCWVRQHEQKRVLIGCEDGRMEVWDVDLPQQVRVFSLSSSGGAVFVVASSSDGSLVASGSYDGTLAVYNARTGDIVHALKSSGVIFSVAFSPTAPIIAFGSESANVSIFSYGDDATDHISSLAAHERYVRCIAFSPNGRYVSSASDDCTIRIWETNTADSAWYDEHHPQEIHRACFSNDGQLAVSASSDKTIKVWDSRTGTLCATLEGHTQSVWDAIILSDNARIVSTDCNDNLILWDWRQGKILCRSAAMTKEHGMFSPVFPYSHDKTTLGFISTRRKPDHWGKHIVCCWTIDATDPNNSRIVLAARGVVDISTSRILRITHRGSTETADLRLILECKSGKQFSTRWHTSSVLTDSPQELRFTEEVGESHIKGVEQPLTASEAPCFQSKDEAWVLDRYGRQILWVPPANRGDGRWHGRRLLIAGKSGRLALVDFSDVNLNDDVLF